MKKTFTFLISLFTFSFIYAECVLVPISLAERVSASELIIEGKVSSIKSYWNADHSMIYTANSIQISKIYKGSQLIQSSTLSIITLGGQVNDKAIKVEPELELEEGEIGIFMLVNKENDWLSESGVQGFIRIDKVDATASDIFNQYPAHSIYNTIQNLTQTSVVKINDLLTKVTVSTKRASPTVTSISPKTLTSGTSTVLTIKGTNFKSARDTSSVQFRNGDDGGSSFIKALKYDYISWSDTMIKLIVRTKAGTGKIRVLVGGNGSVISGDTLKVQYAHLNVVQGDSIAYETQEIGMNNSNGITWKMNKRFYDSAGARGAFVRSLERWRCGTFMNWDTLGRVNHSAIKSDGVNMCAWDTAGSMPNGTLAQCFSFYAGCFTPGLKWYVNELDIRFRIRPTNTTNWLYTTGNANSNQFHFESVAVHELGHGHQLGHVINSAEVMHYAIANGQTKPSLSSGDISGGNYVMTKSATSICGKNSHTKLNSGNCAIIAPVADFKSDKTTVCVGEKVKFSDTSKGNISAYSWNFGSGASPATANTKGPHNVTYSSGGNKTITLTITTSTGSNLNKSSSITVQNDSRLYSKFSWQAAEKGKVTFTNTTTNSVSNKWYFGNGDSSTTLNPIYTYNAGGTYQVKLSGTNTCNTADTTISITLAYMNFRVSPLTACKEQEVTYTDSSDNLVSSWNWSFTGGTPSTATGKGPHKVTYTSSGVKSSSLTITATGGKSQTQTISSATTISNNTYAKANFIFGNYGKNIIGFENKSSGSGLQYKWYFGDGDSSTLQNPVHTYTNANNKVVKLIVTGDCNTDDTTITLRDFTSINQVNNNQYWHVYPNPALNRIYVSNMTENLNYQISNSIGQILKQGTYTSDGINIEKFTTGVYLLQVNGVNLRFVVE